MSYILLYMISLFDMDWKDEALDISDDDIQNIEKAKRFAETFFHRYCKHHFGLKKGSAKKMEIGQFLSETENVTLITTMENLM